MVSPSSRSEPERPAAGLPANLEIAVAGHTRGPWAWRRIDGRWVLRAEHGYREVVLDEFKRLLRCRVDGYMRQVSADHPDMALIALAQQLLAEVLRLRRALALSRELLSAAKIAGRYVESCEP